MYIFEFHLKNGKFLKSGREKRGEAKDLVMLRNPA